MHQVVTAQLAAARQGTHSTKTRGEVSGGGKKPYRQKGTGRARQGSTRSPQFVGGGVSHGPQPRDYSQRTPKKMKAAALRGALSDRARGGNVHVLSSLVEGTAPSTKTARTALAAVASSKNVLIVLSRTDEAGWLSLRNLPETHLLFADQLNTYDVLVSDDVVFTKAALDEFLSFQQVSVDHVRRSRRRLADGDEDAEVSLTTAPAPACSREGGGPVSIADPRDIILKPVVSEKSYGLLETGRYTFEVHPDSNKTQIKIAIEQIFAVKVVSVNTLNRTGKRKRTRAGFGSASRPSARSSRCPRTASRSRSSRAPEAESLE